VLAAVLAIVPFIFLIWLCRRLYFDAPVSDAWALAPLLGKLSAGTLSLADLWSQHNEHRPAVLACGAADPGAGNRLGREGGNGRQHCVGMRHVLDLCRARPRDGTTRRAARVWMLPVLSLLLFSPMQWENWLRGWQMAIFMGVLGSTAV